MMEKVELHDTLTREKRELTPVDGKQFRFYVCGPTVYGPAHIGNFRTFVLFDVFYRVLIAAGLNPRFARNITDVDDKTIKTSQEQGLTLRTFTDRYTEKFHADCDIIGLLRPDVEPRATDHIQEQIDLIAILMEKGHAYQGADGSIYYRVASFPEYGKLSHFDPAALQTQATNSANDLNLADEYERDAVADFALWKAHKPADGENAWDSPWGRGRPGWHIECSAMSMKVLGETFDLHGGGEDLCFPHHENEIAQSEGATGKPFALHWMHAVHLLVEGKKMSKSLGNFFTLDDLLAKGFAPDAIRYLLVSGHYRQQLNFTLKGVEGAASGLKRLRKLAAHLGVPEDAHRQPPPPGSYSGAFAQAWAALRDDLNTPAALGELFKTGAALLSEPPSEEDRTGLHKLLFALGLPPTAPETEKSSAEAPDAIRALAERRWEAKKTRDFATADALRKEITAAGWQVLDAKDGYTLEPLPG